MAASPEKPFRLEVPGKLQKQLGLIERLNKLTFQQAPCGFLFSITESFEIVICVETAVQAKLLESWLSSRFEWVQNLILSTISGFGAQSEGSTQDYKFCGKILIRPQIFKHT